MVYVVEHATKILFSMILEDTAVQDYLEAMKQHHPETALHSKRISVYTMDMYVTRHMTTNRGVVVITQDAITEALEWGIAGIYHDAGKLLVPEEILAKPGALNQEERERMNRHPIFGLDILPEYTKNRAAYHAAVGHHEYKVAASYPRHTRRGEDEIVEAVALADIYDALASKRGYKPAFARDAIVRIMHEEFNGNRVNLDELLQRAA